MIEQVARMLRDMGLVVFKGEESLSACAYVVDVGGLDMLQGPQLSMRAMSDGRWRIDKIDGHPEGSFFELEFDTLDDALAFIEPMSQAIRQTS